MIFQQRHESNISKQSSVILYTFSWSNINLFKSKQSSLISVSASDYFWYYLVLRDSIVVHLIFYHIKTFLGLYVFHISIWYFVCTSTKVAVTFFSILYLSIDINSRIGVLLDTSSLQNYWCVKKNFGFGNTYMLKITQQRFYIYFCNGYLIPPGDPNNAVKYYFRCFFKWENVLQKIKILLWCNIKILFIAWIMH